VLPPQSEAAAGAADGADCDVAARIAALPPLREEIAAVGLGADRSLGQNFLLDLNLLDRIVRAIALRPGETVFEVGPGPGGLTRALLKAGAHVVAVERDPRAVPLLERLGAAAAGRLTLVEGDALAVDAEALAGEGAHIAANLPYNIATPLLAGWLSGDRWPPWWRSATLMFQQEVAERIVAPPGTSAYGRLSVLAQWRTTARIVLTLPPRAFTPAPKVHSAVVQLVPRADAAALPAALVADVTRAAFGQRRKMLRQAMKAMPGGPEALAAAGIDPSRRAETLSVDEFISLARAVPKSPAHSSG
jgi:16S rRNA (adenine1518-N6/adenine1519-N6)-dimethyltransferase